MSRAKWPVGIAAALSLSTGLALAAVPEVKIYELPPGEATPNARNEWKEAQQGATPAGGLALEHRYLLAILKPGATGVVLWAGDGTEDPAETQKARNEKTASADYAPWVTEYPGEKRKGLELAVLDASGQGAPISRVEAIAVGDDRGVRLTAGKMAAEIVLPKHSAVVTVRPGSGAGSLEIRASFHYAVLPDFFANDIVYLPQRFKAERMPVPAENFLFGFLEGKKLMSMALWEGSLSLGERGGEKPEQGGAGAADPRVELRFAGEAAARRIVAQRIEFAGKPVHVGLLASDRALWTDADVTAWKGQAPKMLEWKRPFDAKWRADTICAEGKVSKDFYVESLSYTILSKEDMKWYRGWKDDMGVLHPMDNMQGLWPSWAYAAWFLGADTWIALYADREFRAAKPPPKELPNIFERVLIYPLDRHANTPLQVLTPIDLMRETLGQRPCDYVLDLNGLKKRHHGGDKPMHNETATCGIRDRVIDPLLEKLRKGEPFSEEHKRILACGMKDMLQFLQAVNVRLREFRRAGEEVSKLCEAGEKTPNSQAVARRVVTLAKELCVQLDRLFGDVDKELASWEEKLPGLLKKVESGDATGASAATGICPLAERQDMMMNQARRFMLGIRTQALMTEASSPEAKLFIQQVSELSQKVLARRHPMEWRPFD